MLSKQFSKSILFAAISLGMAGHSFANEPVSEDEIERISVWSTQVNTSSLYLNNGEIANKQADHISDLLRFIPGVDVGGAHSLNQRITIRSMDDKDLKISIDGAAQNTYMYHHMGNLQIHADILKSVDISVGTNSVVNGGLGGAVKFETKTANELLREGQQFGARINVAYADNANQSYSLTGYGQLTDSLDVLAYYNDVTRKNYDVGGSEIRDFHDQVIEGTDGTVRGLEGDVSDALLKFGWDINNDHRITLGYEKYQDKGDYSYRPDMGLATDLAITNSLQVPLLWPTEFTRDTVTLSYDGSIGESTEVDASIYNNESELWRNELGWADNPRFAMWAAIVTGSAKNQGFNVVFDTEIDSAGTGHQFIYGVDYVKHATDYLASTSSASRASSESSTSLALFIEDHIRLSDELTAIPGIRYDDYSIDSAVVDSDFDKTSLALAFEYQPSNNLVLRLSATELFKGPEIGEVFVGAGIDDSLNADIKAEEGYNSEFAIAYQYETDKAGVISVGGNLFKTNIDGYIYDYATVPGTLPQDRMQWKDNVGDMVIDGYEMYLGYEQGSFNAQINFSDAESELTANTEYASLDGARLDRQQGNTISANASYRFESIGAEFNWEALLVGDVNAGLDLDGASQDNSKDGYTVHNIAFKWQPEQADYVTVLLGVDNLFDEYYASHSSRTGLSFHPRFKELFLMDYEPGRNIKATVSVTF